MRLLTAVLFAIVLMSAYASTATECDGADAPSSALQSGAAPEARMHPHDELGWLVTDEFAGLPAWIA